MNIDDVRAYFCDELVDGGWVGVAMPVDVSRPVDGQLEDVEKLIDERIVRPGPGCRHDEREVDASSDKRTIPSSMRAGTPGVIDPQHPHGLGAYGRETRAGILNAMAGQRVALISLEPWDDVWRRNQHLVRELTSQKLVESIVFVEPPQLRKGASAPRQPLPGVTVIRPPLKVPRRFGGLRTSAYWLRRRWLRDIDLLWINDPVLGALCWDRHLAAVYDVTDDWRHASRPQRLTDRLVAAETLLAANVATTVCSAELARRWKQRYGVDAAVVQNAATAPSYLDVVPRQLDGVGPHVGYVGTLHGERLDVDLVLQLAASSAVGTVDLIGPDALSASDRDRLRQSSKIVFRGSVAAPEVPAWMMGLDLLVAPHVVTDFTLSLDAIKAFEYLATDRPVVAAPTSGFQDLTAPGLAVVAADRFVAAVEGYLRSPPHVNRKVATWAERAKEFVAAAVSSSITSSVVG